MRNSKIFPIIDIAIIAITIALAAVYNWPDRTAGIISTAALIIASIASGVSISNLIRRRDNGGQK